ncbi:PaaI family thioesterase [Williamsia muralis]|uniref:PaaI family thioesterase n=1 Tax=Williamsia marianensis TaxID=85044 RepID=UPI00381ABA43
MKTTFVLPDELVPAERSAKAPAPGEVVRAHNPMCFGCGDRSEAGLHMKAIAGEGTDVTARMQVEPRFEGGPGVIHGGILSTAFDEVMGLTHWMVGAIAVTAHLEIDFAKPIPVGSELRLEAETVGTIRRKLYSRAVAYLGDDTEPVGAAHAIFVQIKPLEHFKDSFEASGAAEFYGERIARHDRGSSSV